LTAVLSLASVFTRSLGDRLALCDSALAMARRLRDPNTLASALYFCAVTVCQSSQVDRALDLATEMARLAREANNGERLLDARLYRAGHLLKKGSRKEVEAELAAHAPLAEELRHPVHQ
jgi:hypothetical protein